MKKHILFAAGAMLAAVLMTGCGSKPAETTAAATAAETESTAAETTQAAGSEAESSEAEVSADNPFAGKTVKVGCSATFVPFESIEMAADGSKNYVGMNIDIVKAIVEKNGDSFGKPIAKQSSVLSRRLIFNVSLFFRNSLAPAPSMMQASARLLFTSSMQAGLP